MALAPKDKVKFKKEFLEEAKARFGLTTKEVSKKFTVKDFKFTNVFLEELIIEIKEHPEVPLDWLEAANIK